MLGGFAQLVRREWRSLLTASLLFYGSLLGMGLLVYLFPELVYSVEMKKPAEAQAFLAALSQVDNNNKVMLVTGAQEIDL